MARFDWLHFSKDVQQVMADYWKDVDTILMGRKTYAVSVAQRPKKSKSAKRKEPTMRTLVFSRTLKELDDPGVQLVASDAVEFVRDLKQESGKDICLTSQISSGRAQPKAFRGISYFLLTVLFRETL